MKYFTVKGYGTGNWSNSGIGAGDQGMMNDLICGQMGKAG